MNFLLLGIVLFIVLAIGGGVGYFIWISSRPKKMTWKAKVYQLGEGIMPPIKEKGIVVANLRLADLIPYTQDVVEKIDKKDGSTNYWLQKMKKAVPVVTADCVEVWGQNNKWVSILLEGDTCTLLKKGYDKRTGQIIFTPLSHDRLNMIKTETEERCARIENTKDILAQITPFIVVAIAMLGLVTIVYFQVQGVIKTAEIQENGANLIAGATNNLANSLMQSSGCIVDLLPEVKEEKPPTIPA